MSFSIPLHSIQKTHPTTQPCWCDRKTGILQDHPVWEWQWTNTVSFLHLCFPKWPSSHAVFLPYMILIPSVCIRVFFSLAPKLWKFQCFISHLHRNLWLDQHSPTDRASGPEERCCFAFRAFILRAENISRDVNSRYFEKLSKEKTESLNETPNCCLRIK